MVHHDFVFRKTEYADARHFLSLCFIVCISARQSLTSSCRKHLLYNFLPIFEIIFHFTSLSLYRSIVCIFTSLRSSNIFVIPFPLGNFVFRGSIVFVQGILTSSTRILAFLAIFTPSRLFSKSIPTYFACFFHNVIILDDDDLINYTRTL